MFHDVDEVDQLRQTSCECCGHWFWNTKGGQFYCDQCKADKAMVKREKQADRELYLRNRTARQPSKESMAKATVIWEHLIANREQGVEPWKCTDVLFAAGLINFRGSTEILTCLEYAGFLVYTANGRIYPYKNLNNGEEY